MPPSGLCAWTCEEGHGSGDGDQVGDALYSSHGTDIGCQGVSRVVPIEFSFLEGEKILLFFEHTDAQLKSGFPAAKADAGDKDPIEGLHQEGALFEGALSA